MPLVNVTLAAKPDGELTTRAIALLTDLTVEVLGEASGYVAVEELPADAWGYLGETQELHYLKNKLA